MAEEVEGHAVEPVRAVEGGQRRRLPLGPGDLMTVLPEKPSEEGPVGGAAVYDEDPPPPEPRRAGILVAPGPALPEQRADAQDHQVPVGGFRQVGIGAALQALALAAAAPGQHQHGQGAGAQREPHLPDQLVAVHPGQVVIGDEEVGLGLVEGVEGSLGAGAAGHAETVALQEEPQLQGLRLGILDEEDPRLSLRGACHGAAPGMASRRTCPATRSRGRTARAAPRRTAAAGIP